MKKQVDATGLEEKMAANLELLIKYMLVGDILFLIKRNIFNIRCMQEKQKIKLIKIVHF